MALVEKKPSFSSFHFRQLPHPVSYYGYVMCYHGIMAGPMAFFVEYQDFINGTNYYKPSPSSVSNVSEFKCKTDVEKRRENWTKENELLQRMGSFEVKMENTVNIITFVNAIFLANFKCENWVMLWWLSGGRVISFSKTFLSKY